MRVVQWNVNGAFHRKQSRLFGLGADVAVLCEVPQQPPETSMLDPDIDWHWAGTLPNRGIAVAGIGTNLAPVDGVTGSGSHCVAAEHPEGLGILGIWSVPQTGKRYCREVELAIDAHESWLTRGPCVIAGDFNVSPLGAEDTATQALRRLWERLDALGYLSAYHHATGEPYGAESAPTYFHRRKQQDPFFIDFVFVHRDLCEGLGVTTGTYDEWVAPTATGYGASDHVPVIVDVTPLSHR